MESTLYPLFFIPFFGILIIIPMKFDTKENIIKGKQIALLTSIVALIESIRLWIGFDTSTSEFQYVIKIDWIEMLDIGMTLGVDGISIFYILLTTLLIPICLLASWDSIKYLNKEYLICFLSIEFLLIGVFTILDLLGFYILFEGILIPMYLVIGVWGARKEKITAAYYFFFYTLVGSVLMLISIMYIYKEYGTTDYQVLLTAPRLPTGMIQNLVFLAFFASFAVKIPKFPFHIWLPLAHVEAPVAGSVLLAGILIKLGSYGFIRYSLPLLPDASIYFTPLIFTLGTLAVIYASLTTLRQTDLKRIIAYSSVSHMGVVMLSIFTLTVTGLEGSIFLQIAHGLVSSALFIVVTVLYDRHHTRTVKYYRGVTLTMPIYSFIFLFFTLGNIAVPGSCNFIGEFISLIATFESNMWIAVLASIGMVLSACYALFLYNRVCMGTMSKYIEHSTENRDVNRREFYVLFPLMFLTLYLGVYPDIILDAIHPSVLHLVSYIT